MLFLIFASSFVRTSVLITQFLNLFAAYLSNEYETKYFLTGQKSLSVETSSFFFVLQSLESRQAVLAAAS